MGDLDKADDIFGDAKMSEILLILRIERSDPRVEAFRDALTSLGHKWRKTIRTSPVDFPISARGVAPSKRIRWLENNIEKLAKKLRKNLEGQYEANFSTWGSLEAVDLQFSRDPIQRELGALLVHIDELIRDLRKQENEGAPQTGEMRYEIVWELVQLFRLHCPELPRSEGTYDVETHRSIGFLPEFAFAAFSEITGGEPPLGKQLNSLLRIALKD